MRTTVNIHDDLLERAKSLANERHTSLSALVSDGLRLLFFTSTKNVKRPLTHVITFKGNGIHSGIDLDSNRSMLAVMEE